MTSSRKKGIGGPGRISSGTTGRAVGRWMTPRREKQWSGWDSRWTRASPRWVRIAPSERVR
jgi:hypothetical protein